MSKEDNPKLWAIRNKKTDDYFLRFKDEEINEYFGPPEDLEVFDVHLVPLPQDDVRLLLMPETGLVH